MEKQTAGKPSFWQGVRRNYAELTVQEQGVDVEKAKRIYKGRWHCLYNNCKQERGTIFLRMAFDMAYLDPDGEIHIIKNKRQFDRVYALIKMWENEHKYDEFAD